MRVRFPEVLARLSTHLRQSHVHRPAAVAVKLAGLGALTMDAQERLAPRAAAAAVAATLLRNEGA